MSDYLSIFKVRSRLDSLRQSRVGNQLVQLEECLKPGQTPYDRNQVLRTALMSFDSFAIGACGRTVPPPSGPFLYRVSPLSMVQQHTKWKEDSEISLESALGELILRSELIGDPDGWFPLSEVAEGELSSYRQFTWWSSSPVRKDTVICDLHLRGMPNDWIAESSL